MQSSLQAELVSLKLQIQSLHETLGNLTHENDLLKRRLFGTKSERSQHFFTAVADCEHVLFAYVERHTQDAVKSLFKGFKGYLQCDASNVYDILERGPPTEHGESVSLVGCFAHCRRYFFEAAICKYPVGVEGLARIRAMYAVDDAFQKMPPSKRLPMRDAHLRPLMDDFFAWVHRAI